MSWIDVLYKTYENLEQSPHVKDLLPIAHTTQKAQIVVTISDTAEFVSAKVIPKADSETLIPCTEESGGRSGSAPIHHPLMDKLQYLAGDYTAFGGAKGESFHLKYMEDLRKWCASEYRNEKVCILKDYLEKGTLIADLRDAGVIHCDENNRMIEKWADKATTPEIYKEVQGNQSDAFVRFYVNKVGEGNDETALWQDKQLQQDYIQYYLSVRETDGICCVTGNETSCTVNHPNKIRNTGDKAKLISANDESGFTYRGRFNNFKEAAQVSYEVSQKAHSALKWLIKHQGTNYGSRVFVTWNPGNEAVPDITLDSFDLFQGISQEAVEYDSGGEFFKRFKNALYSYGSDLSHNGNVVIMGVDAATTGRMAITFYREMLRNELVERILTWHESCRWVIPHYFRETKKTVWLECAPSPGSIALAAFGTEKTYLEMNDKLYAQVVERLLHCIADGQSLPEDVVNGAFRNACHPHNYKSSYNWRMVFGVCCALVKKQRFDQYGEVWTLEVQKEKQDISYLCGRLLAVADAAERSILTMRGETRETAALRYFTKFRERPCATWEKIRDSLIPYMNRMKPSIRIYYEKLLSEISAMIPEDEFAAAKELDGRMALGFDAQRNEIYKKKETTSSDDDTDEENAE